MRYISTRGAAPALGFTDVLLAGLARDGGLYVPESWPRIAPDEIRKLRGASYQEIAFHVMRPFIGGEIADPDHRWANAYGVADDGAVLVRPDGFVAWRSQGAAADPTSALSTALRQILATPAPAVAVAEA